jgi:5-methylcytosine-specific restriction endonuclease McrA
MKPKRTAAELVGIEWPDGGPPPFHDTRFRREVRTAWRKQFGGKCQGCGHGMAFDVRDQQMPNFATIDHINARGLGGSEELHNVQVICARCNNKKSLQEHWIARERRSNNDVSVL